MKKAFRICTLTLVALAGSASAAPWQQLATQDGRKLEYDPGSVRKEGDRIVATARTIFDKAVPDAVSGVSYRVLEVTGRYDCDKRTVGSLKRVYRKEQDDTIREEVSKTPNDLPVRSGTLDDKVLKAVCSPASTSTTDNRSTGGTRKELLKADLGSQKAGAVTATTPAAPRAPVARKSTQAAAAGAAQDGGILWSYEGANGPAAWASLSPDNRLCAAGQRQSPIDIRDELALDLTPIEFRYRPSLFRITDNGRTIQVEAGGNSITVLDTRYELVRLEFHRPAEERIDGRAFAMGIHLIHRSAQGKLAVVALLLEPGRENPVIQTLWNHLPLEKDRAIAPPKAEIDLGRLLPEQRAYYTYMGSLTAPPCSEGVLWLVLRKAVEISAEQAEVFARYYKHNARPLQATNGRLIKGSR